jgi:hypothetical protein
MEGETNTEHSLDHRAMLFRDRIVYEVLPCSNSPFVL